VTLPTRSSRRAAAARAVVRRTAVLVLGILALSSGLLGIPASAVAASETVVELPLTSVRDVVVDDAHGHVFVTGWGSDHVVVRDLDGAAVTTITGQQGAAQMTLSPDGSTLYVALDEGDAVSAISTTTLSEVMRYPTGAGTCPTTLAVTMGKLWFGYGCYGEGKGNLGVIDPAAQPATVVMDKAAWIFYDAPGLQASAAKPGLLVGGRMGGSPSRLRLLDVSSGDVVLGAEVEPGSNLQDFAITADGTHVITASGGPYRHLAFRTTDLSHDGVYGWLDAYPNAVAVGAGGFVAAGRHAFDAPDVYLYESEGPLMRRIELGGDATGEHRLGAAGLAFNADATRLYAVTDTRGSGDPARLHVLSLAKQPTSVALEVPTRVDINQAYSLIGRLSSAEPLRAGSVVTVQREGVDGTVALPSRATSTDGSFTIPDTVSKRGLYSYRVSFAGDGAHTASSATVTVRAYGLAPNLAITTAPGPYDYGARPTVTAHLDTSSSEVLTLFAEPYGGGSSLLQTGPVDSLGNLSAPYTMSRRTTFAVSFPGDETYEPASATKVLFSRAKITAAMTGHYAWSGSYRLFHEGVDPTLRATVAPNNAGVCLDFVVQVLSGGSWRTSATLPCSRLMSDSQATTPYASSLLVGSRFRTRAVFKGSTSNVPTNGLWQYGKVTT